MRLVDEVIADINAGADPAPIAVRLAKELEDTREAWAKEVIACEEQALRAKLERALGLLKNMVEYGPSDLTEPERDQHALEILALLAEEA